jgi:hypothetical protein
MKNLLLFLIFIFSFHAFAQKSVEVTNVKTGAIVIFEQSQRVKVVTKNKEKHFGRIEIADAETISLSGEVIKLDDIYNIKSHSVGRAIGSGVVIAAGYVIIVAGLVVALTATPGAGIIVISGLAVGTLGIAMPNLTENHKNKSWTYKIIGI